MKTFPNQRTSTREKLKKENGSKIPTWIKQCHDYFAYELGKYGDDKVELQKLYKMAAGQFEMDDTYSYVTNPYGLKEGKDNDALKRYPARLRNYDIITPVIDRFLGERRERNTDLQIVSLNPDSVSQYKNQVRNQYIKTLQQMFINEMAANGVQIQPQEVQVKLEEVEKKVTLGYADIRAKNGQTAFEALKQDLRLEDKLQQAYYDYLVTGRCITFKDVNHDDVEYQIVSPLDVTFIGMDENSPYGEDAVAVVRDMRWSAASIIDNFREDLSEDDIDWLKKYESNQFGNNNNGYSTGGDYKVAGSNWFLSNGNTYAEFETGLIPVQHVVWKTLVKRGILTYIDPATAQVTTKLVDDEYVLNKEAGDIEIEWTWENEWWESWRASENQNRIGGNSDLKCIYLKYGSGEVQRTDINNSSACKLSYNMVTRGYRHNGIVSVVKQGMPYQELYNIFHYRFELMLGRSLDKLLVLPLGLVPETKGWSLDKFMYFIRSFSIMVINESSPKAQLAITALKEIDMSLGKYMGDMWTFMQQIREEWWDSVGFNRQRYGQVMASDGKGANQQAVFASAVSTKDMVSQFESFIETEINGLLDYSKFAWIAGKQGMLRQDDGTVAFYEVDGILHRETEYGVYATKSVEERDRVQFFKNVLLQPASQNGMPAGTMARILRTNSMAKIVELADEGDRIEKEFQMQLEQQRAQAQQDAANKVLEAEQMRNEMKKYEIDTRFEMEIEKAMIMADSFNAKEGDTDADGIPEAEEIAQRSFERLVAMGKLQEQKRSNQVKERIAEKGLELKDKQMKMKKKESSK